MTVIVPDDYHVKQALEDNRITCIPNQDALHQDIRPLRIGILNIMPICQEYEFNLLHPLGISIIQVEPVWIRLESHSYKSSNQDHVSSLYQTYEEATRDQALDGMIITGAPIERIRFEEVKYWEEIRAILLDLRENCPSTVGICWGAFALAYLEGVDKFNYSDKLFGVFEVNNLAPFHPIVGELDDVFHCPQSRYAGIDDRLLEEAEKEGKFKLLAHSKECGYAIFETPNHRFIMHTGHPEYNAQRLVQETQRDFAHLDPIPNPANFDLQQPVNRWKTHRNVFFMQWLKYCYLCMNQHNQAIPSSS